MDIFDYMTKTKKVCEVCGGYLHYHKNHDCYYCTDCEWEDLVDFYHHDNMVYDN